MEDLEYARTQWLQQEPVYAAFGAYLDAQLATIARRTGVPADVSVRTKEIDSLLKKLLRKPEHTYGSLGDKLGARIIVKRLRMFRRSATPFGLSSRAVRLKTRRIVLLTIRSAISVCTSISDC
jgi:hypothetical protein